jgi:hypothetical protein
MSRSRESWVSNINGDQREGAKGSSTVARFTQIPQIKTRLTISTIRRTTELPHVARLQGARISTVNKSLQSDRFTAVTS